MSRGQHAASDGSFGRSAGAAGARAVLLIVVAVALGVVLLRATDGTEVPRVATANDDGDNRGTTPPDHEEDPDTTAPPTTHPTAEVTVLVVNGSGVQGAAGRTSDTIEAANYVTLDPANLTPAVSASVVYFIPGYEPDASAIATLLNAASPPAVEALPDPPPVAPGSAHVMVVLAPDLAGS